MSQTYRMGPARWTFDGVVQDFLTRGAEVTITPKFKTMTWDQTGEAPYDDVLTGAEVSAKIIMAIKETEDIAKFIPWANKITDGVKVLVDGVINVGLSMRTKGKSLLLHPLDLPDDDYSNDFYMPLAVCISPFKLIYKSVEESVYESEWKGYIDNMTNKRLFQIGDRTAAADTTAPTVASSVPVAAATGISKASGLNIDFVMSEAVDPVSVIKANTLMMKTTDGSIFSNYTVNYISATNTIRLTTGAALAATTEYMVTLTTGVKDLNGNALAAPVTLKFTTGA